MSLVPGEGPDVGFGAPQIVNGEGTQYIALRLGDIHGGLPALFADEAMHHVDEDSFLQTLRTFNPDLTNATLAAFINGTDLPPGQMIKLPLQLLSGDPLPLTRVALVKTALYRRDHPTLPPAEQIALPNPAPSEPQDPTQDRHLAKEGQAYAFVNVPRIAFRPDKGISSIILPGSADLDRLRAYEVVNDPNVLQDGRANVGNFRLYASYPATIIIPISTGDQLTHLQRCLEPPYVLVIGEDRKISIVADEALAHQYDLLGRYNPTLEGIFAIALREPVRSYDDAPATQMAAARSSPPAIKDAVLTGQLGAERLLPKVSLADVSMPHPVPMEANISVQYGDPHTGEDMARASALNSIYPVHVPGVVATRSLERVSSPGELAAAEAERRAEIIAAEEAELKARNLSIQAVVATHLIEEARLEREGSAALRTADQTDREAVRLAREAIERSLAMRNAVAERTAHAERVVLTAEAKLGREDRLPPVVLANVAPLPWGFLGLSEEARDALDEEVKSVRSRDALAQFAQDFGKGFLTVASLPLIGAVAIAQKLTGTADAAGARSSRSLPNPMHSPEEGAGLGKALALYPVTHSEMRLFDSAAFDRAVAARKTRIEEPPPPKPEAPAPTSPLPPAPVASDPPPPPPVVTHQEPSSLPTVVDPLPADEAIVSAKNGIRIIDGDKHLWGILEAAGYKTNQAKRQMVDAIEALNKEHHTEGFSTSKKQGFMGVDHIHVGQVLEVPAELIGRLEKQLDARGESARLVSLKQENGKLVPAP